MGCVVELAKKALKGRNLLAGGYRPLQDVNLNQYVSEKILYILSLIIMLLSQSLQAQPEIVDRQKYPFINFEGNKLYMPTPYALMPVFRKLERLVKRGDQQINIIQIGDSHIQADIFSERMRTQIQQFFPGGNGGRGFIFPYAMAHTNNPANYKVTYTGNWESCKCVQANKECNLGLSGITVTTSDSFSTISIRPASFSGVSYDYTKIRLFYGADDSAFALALANISPAGLMSTNRLPGMIEWNLASGINEVDITISRRAGEKKTFSLYGIALETRDPGIVYHATGVNGAEVVSYLRCNLLPLHLQALAPDLVVVSLGTNDAYTTNFDTTAFYDNYTKLLKEIQKENPGVPILLTTPGDCYMRRAPNQNNIKAGEVIKKIADENGFAVWDFFNTMGGLGSVNKWFANGLTAKDKVHLTWNGYKLQGDLLFEAFINAFDNYLDEKDSEKLEGRK